MQKVLCKPIQKIIISKYCNLSYIQLSGECGVCLGSERYNKLKGIHWKVYQVNVFTRTFQRNWNDVTLAPRAVCLFVSAFFRTCTTKSRKQTVEPRSVIFCCKNIQVDKARSSVDFHPYHQRRWHSFSRSKIRFEFSGKFIHDYLATRKKNRYDKHCSWQQIESACGLSIGIFTFDLGPV